MNPRKRIVAGAIALTAMAFSFAESVLASVCAPVAEMDGMAAAMMGGSGEHGEKSTDGTPMPSVADDEAGGRNECPLGPALGQGCSAVPSLPGSHSSAGVPGDHGLPRIASDDIRPDLLLTHGLFHPPRA